MVVVWVSGLAVSRRLDKGIQKGGRNKIKKKIINKIKKNKQTNKKQTNKQKQQNKDKKNTKELDRGLIKCSQGIRYAPKNKNSVEMR